MYLYVYEFSKEPGVRSLQFDTAVSLWRLLLGEKYPIVEDWIQFLESRDKKNDVSKDTWNMLLTFCETIAR